MPNLILIGTKLKLSYFWRFGQFISSTLPTFAVCEKFVDMEINNEEKIDGGNIKLHTLMQFMCSVKPNLSERNFRLL